MTELQERPPSAAEQGVLDTKDDGSVPPAVQLPSDVLYDDQYVRLTETQVIIKKYYFPFGNAKRIDYGAIESCATDKQLGIGMLEYKAWGMALSSIWWAWGGMRQDKSNLVITVRDCWPRCGFCVADMAKVQAILRDKGVRGAVTTDL